MEAGRARDTPLAGGLGRRLPGGPAEGIAGWTGAALTLVLGVFYIARSEVLFFPDGYIYAAHARTFATTLTWGINAGETSFSVTSPLWTLICATVHLVVPQSAGYVLAMQIVGLAFMAASLLLFDRVLHQLATPLRWRLVFCALFAAIPFNGFFYAISLMETPLFIFLFFAAVLLTLESQQGPYSDARVVVAGIVAGLLFLTRVEGAMALPAMLAVSLVRRDPVPVLLRNGTIVGLVFLSIVAPWQAYLYGAADALVPTSGKGRLYLYFPLQSLEVSEYLALGVLERVALLGESVRMNFLKHPVILVFGVLPTVVLTFLALVGRPLWRQREGLAQALAFLLVFNVLNLLLYLLFHPFIYQRYFIVALPSLLIVVAALAPEIDRRVRPLLRNALLAVGALTIAALNVVAVSYFDTPTRNDRRIIALFQKLNTDRPDGCRLAAEPLGIAAWFTQCYVVDLGGLINPDIWPLWIAAGRKGIDAVNARYAIDQRADFLYLPTAGMLAGFESRFAPAYSSSGSEAIYRAVR